MPSPICSGCFRGFRNSTGYQNHIRFSRDPACHSIFEADAANFPGAEDNTLPNPIFDGYHPPSPTQAAFSNPTAPTATSAATGLGFEPMDDSEPVPEPQTRLDTEGRVLNHVFIENFPGDAGKQAIGPSNLAYREYEQECNALGLQSGHPQVFASKLDWLVAKWSKLRGPGSTALTELLQIQEVKERLGLSYANSTELNEIIDTKLPSPPKFQRREVKFGHDVYEFYTRDALECVHSLYSDPEFAGRLDFVPERHYADKDKTIRVFSELKTGRFWWDRQKRIEAVSPGATLAPIIISSDRTKLANFGNKSAYPVYLTIGNIPKDIRRKPSRRAYVLLGYLPTTRMTHISNESARRRMLINLFHACMDEMLSPIKEAGRTGVNMASGDGAIRRVHPIFACFAGDYPEQCLACGTKNGECPKCGMHNATLGDYDTDSEYVLRDIEDVLDVLKLQGRPEYAAACKEVGIKPIYHPFWEDLPYADIYAGLTPDILHQQYQGTVKHLINWLKEAFGEEEIDARCQRLPPNHNIRIFKDGISILSRITGKEHADICRVLLGLIVDLRLPDGHSPLRLVRAVRALLDFLYLSQYPVHSDETLASLQVALETFHKNKQVFIDLRIRSHFNFPKMHSLVHYPHSIQLFGTTDNYNTEYTERLHIDYTKDAWRATNHKDEISQMTLWLERREKIIRYDRYMQWMSNGKQDLTNDATDSTPKAHIKMTKWPSAKAIPLKIVEEDYGATFLRDALARYVAQVNAGETRLSRRQLEDRSCDVFIPFNALPVYHKIRFSNTHAHGFDILAGTVEDVAHAKPARTNKAGFDVPARFDTVLVNTGNGGRTGVKGYRVAQIRVVFSLHPDARAALFPNANPPEHFAYVEWFTPFGTRPENDHGMYKLSRQLDSDGSRIASIIPVNSIRRTVYLFPRFGHVAPRQWRSDNVLEQCPTFFVNPFTDRHNYTTVI